MDRVGDYQLEALIGEGTSGTVWRARRLGPFPRTVAVKRAGGQGRRSTPGTQERLRAEATLLADLDHPHIVDVFDVLDDEEGVAIVMQLAQGGSLRAMLDERGTLPAGEVVAMAVPLADALASAHRRGLVHGDVKPANILFTSDGEPLLSDFGAARHLGAPLAPGAPVAGSAPYLDPQLLDGVASGPSSDLYSLGVVCYEALLGAPPYDGSPEDVVVAAARGRHRSLTDLHAIPEPLATLVELAIRKNPDDRPGSLGQFATDLRASVSPALVQLPRPSRPGPSPIRPADATTGAASVTAGGTAATGHHGTRLFGPRPPRRHVPDERAGRRIPAVPIVLGVAAVLLAGAGWLRRDHGDRAGRRSATATSLASPCRAFPRLAAARGAERFSVDLNGDGCPVPVAWDGDVLSARFDSDDRMPRYYEVGAPGDVLLFGDWDCDRAESPALYRPGTGEVLYVNSFAAGIGDQSYAEVISRGWPRRGTPRVVRGVDGCDEVRISRSRS